MADDRFFFSEDAEYFDTVDMMERHIGRWLFSEKKQNKWQNKQDHFEGKNNGWITAILCVNQMKTA